MLVLSAVLFTCFGLGDLLGHRDLPGSPEMANYLIAADEQRDALRMVASPATIEPLR